MNELALKDIHLPEVGLWWPMAPGWWLLLILVFLFIFYAPRILRWLRWKPAKKVALRELARIRAEMNEGLDQQQVSQQISILLRRTAISYCGRAVGASITGKQWVEQLNQLSGNESFTAEQNEWLIVGQYQPSAACDLQAMLQSCENWLNALPRKSPHVAG
jgi:hypothetical protein